MKNYLDNCEACDKHTSVTDCVIRDAVYDDVIKTSALCLECIDEIEDDGEYVVVPIF